MSLLLVLLAIYVGFGTLLMPQAENYRHELEQRLSLALGMPLSIASLEGSWQRFNPVLDARQLQIQVAEGDAAAGGSTVLIENMSFMLDVPGSLRQRRLVVAAVKVEDLTLEFQELPDGRWHLAGLEREGIAQLNAGELFSLATRLAHVELVNTSVALHHFSGETSHLSDGLLRFQSRDDHHMLQLDAFYADSGQLMSFSAEMNGGSIQDLNGRAHLFLPERDYSAFFRGRQIAGMRAERLLLGGEAWWTVKQGAVRQASAELHMPELVLETEHDTVLLNGLATRLAMRINAEDTRREFWVRDLSFRYGSSTWPTGDFYAVQIPGENIEVQAEKLALGLANRIISELALLPEAGLNELRRLNPRGQLHNTVINIQSDSGAPELYSLSGNLAGLSVNTYNGAPSVWGVNGYLELTHQVPLQRTEGFVEVDSDELMLQLPDLFDDIWIYDYVNGRVGFRVDLSDGFRLRVASNAITAQSDIIDGRIQFATEFLDTPDTERTITLELMVGALEADVGRKSAYLPMAPTAPASAQGVLGWVNDAVISGISRNSGLIFRGEIQRGARPVARTLQMYFNIEDGQLQFDPDWPALDGINGYVRVDDNEVDVSASGGSSLGIEFNATTAAVRPNPGGGYWLTASGQGLGAAGQGLEYLRNTPVTEELGTYLADWRTQGDVSFTLDLAVPLGIEGEGPQIQLGLGMNDNHVYIPEYDLQVDELSGELIYNEQTGLSSQELTAVFFGRPVDVAISTYGPGEERFGTLVEVEGRMLLEDLKQWSLLPGMLPELLAEAGGEFSYSASLDLPQRSGAGSSVPRLSVRTDLAGVELAYPAPFNKAVAREMPLNMDLRFMDSGPQLQATLGELMTANLRFGETGLDSGLIYFGAPRDGVRIRRLNPGAPGVEVLGHVERLDFQRWQQLLSNGSASSQDASRLGGSAGMGDFVGVVDVSIGELTVFDERLADVNVQLQSVGEAWQLSLLSDAVAGHITFPNDSSAPLIAEFSHIHLASSVLEESEQETEDETGPAAAAPRSDAVAAVTEPPGPSSRGEDASSEHPRSMADAGADGESRSTEPDGQQPGLSDGGTAAEWGGDGIELGAGFLQTVEYVMPRSDPLADLDPRSFPALRFSVDSLTLGGVDYGSWRFDLQPGTDGAEFSNLLVSARGLNIGTAQEPASFTWYYDGRAHSSRLNAMVTAQNMANVLSAYGYAPSLESNSARFDADLSWSGSPAFFSAVGLNGKLGLLIENGRFLQRVGGGGSSALKLISIINFDALVRRLRFSDDLVRSGLAYDEIRGQVELNEGVVSIVDRLQIIGPSSLFQISGDIDLPNETIDGSMYITLPISDNIPWLSGLAVLNNLINWQLAVGVFLFERVFGDQVDNLTSAHYSLKGSWDELEPRLQQVFANGN